MRLDRRRKIAGFPNTFVDRETDQSAGLGDADQFIKSLRPQMTVGEDANVQCGIIAVVDCGEGLWLGSRLSNLR